MGEIKAAVIDITYANDEHCTGDEIEVSNCDGATIFCFDNEYFDASEFDEETKSELQGIVKQIADIEEQMKIDEEQMKLETMLHEQRQMQFQIEFQQLALRRLTRS